MNPYDAKKVNISNKLYSSISENKNSNHKTERLKKEAVKKLNIKFED